MKKVCVLLICWCFILGGIVRCSDVGAAEVPPPFKLAPAVAVEAEHFTIEKGWKPIGNGEGNYNVDIIGFGHISGEKYLHLPSWDSTGSAFKDINVPVAGAYRLWLRYEYMPFTEAQVKVVVEQGGKIVAEKIMCTKGSPKTCPWSDGTKLEPQYDPPWGNEGITEEPMDIPNLAAGPARIRLLGVEQPKVEGVAANRNIDCIYLTSDVKDEWRKQPRYKGWYGILPAMGDTVGARYEVQYVNRGDKPLSITTTHIYNRVPWYVDEPGLGVKDLAPGATSPWIPILLQDLSHFSLSWFKPAVSQAFTVSIRPVGGGAAEEIVESQGDSVGIYLPTYPNKGEKAINVLKVLDQLTTAVKAAVPAPGKTPTLPLCYGSLPYEQDNEYGRKYAQLFASLGMRNTGPFVNAGVNDRVKHYKNLQALGLGPTRSATYMEYRFPPTPENIAKAKDLMIKSDALKDMRWFDYGDEIGFGEWFTYMMEQRKKIENKPDLTVESMILPLWQAWLQKNRPGFKPEDYWRSAWGAIDLAKLRPDSSAEAAVEKPKLYVDSVIFYEDVSIGFVAEGAKAVKAAFGDQVLPGCNYSVYPYYYPHTPMYVKWFRKGAAEKGQQSEYFWQFGQVTPMINGFVAEYFRAGMRFNPKAILKQYTMPHSPGNTDGDFRRTAFTHIAHGAKNLDFFGIGLPEAFTENHISWRDPDRFVAIRDITHSMALVEDVLEESQVVASPVALLVSESTERWDHAKVGNDHLTKGQPERKFRESRTTYHQDRVGIYTALTFAGFSPDIVVEEDLNPEILKGYKALFLVGDSIPASALPAIEAWVRNGGVLFATAGVGRFGIYREPNTGMQKFLGIEERKLDERDTFVRTSQELPFLKPLGRVMTDTGAFPALAINERIKPSPDARTLAVFADDSSPAMIVRELGKGKIYYTAALPGLAYLYTGLTTPKIWVPDRGPGVHRSVTTYDKAAAEMMVSVLDSAGIKPMVVTSPDYIDTRLIRCKNTFILPLANYNEKIGQPVAILVRPPEGAGQPTGAVSAFCGKVNVEVKDGNWFLALPRLGFGDILRIDTK